MYFLDLTRKNLELVEFKYEDLDDDLKDLSSTSDYKVFETESDAHKYLKTYEATLKGLDNKKICKSRDYPALLLKRRYIVQILLGEKKSTLRHYKKLWPPGQLFNFHDQTYFLSVRLESLERQSSGLYEYKFTLL